VRGVKKMISIDIKAPTALSRIGLLAKIKVKIQIQQLDTLTY
jgi:hypothetical protein